MVHVCLTCLTSYKPLYAQIFHSSNSSHDYSDPPCVTVDCCGSVIELDEMIAPAIVLLNKKGYYTTYCCSGHISNLTDSEPSYFYVLFSDDNDYLHDETSKLPKNFYVEYPSNPNQDGFIIRYQTKKTKPTSAIEEMKMIIKINSEFLSWAEQLPENPYYDEC